MNYDFDTFLSHNTEDKPAARELRTILLERKLRVWFDETEIRPGTLFLPTIDQGLRSSGSVSILIGKAGFGPFHAAETRTALAQASELERPVIPVLLEGCPLAKHKDEALFKRRYVDFRKGFHDQGIDELIWGITGEKPDRRLLSGEPHYLSALKWILVAGSGGLTPRPRLVDELSENLGVAIANAGFGLITGGWDGVDSLTASAFTNATLVSGKSLSGRLLQIMQLGDTPDYPAGRLVNLGDENEAWKHSIERSDAVVLIGGMGGTWQTGEWAESMNKPVFPIVQSRGKLNTHSDAHDFYRKTIESWESSALAHKLTKDSFESLANPPPFVIADLIRLMRLAL